MPFETNDYTVDLAVTIRYVGRNVTRDQLDKDVEQLKKKLNEKAAAAFGKLDVDVKPAVVTQLLQHAPT